MTVIDLHVYETFTSDGFVEITGGTVTAQYWAGGAPYIAVDSDGVVFPAYMTVPVVDGQLTTVLDLTPTNEFCCVRWDVQYGLHHLTRYTLVPETGPVDFGDLVDVDPNTLVPSDGNVAAWEAIAASQIESGTVDSAGQLILSARDGSTQDAGHVRGSQGLQGGPGASLPGVTWGREAIGTRYDINATATNADLCRLQYFYASRDRTLTNVALMVSAAIAGATLIRAGLYQVDGAGNLTLAGKTGNMVGLLPSNSLNAFPLDASLNVVAGQRLALVILQVGGTGGLFLGGNLNSGSLGIPS